MTALSTPSGQPSIPCFGLAKGMVLAAVRKTGVPLQRVRPALAVLDREIVVEHALASRRLYMGGAELLFDHAEEVSDWTTGRQCSVSWSWSAAASESSPR